MNAEPDQSGERPEELALPEIPTWACLLILAILPLAVLGPILFFRPHEVLSDARWDLNFFFVHWRYFGFHELKSGHLPLWNPACSGGSPFFGNFQSALLYPLNFLYLLLPLGPAINWTIALHLWLGGVFMFYWVRHRRLHSLACLLAAVMFMFCGPHFLQIQTGHLPNLATLIWAPLLLLAIDRMMDRPGLGPCLLGMFAFAMSVLAGHPQYVFYLGVGAGIYSLLNLARAEQKGKIAMGLAGIVIGGVGLSAVQLLTGFQEGRESIRSLGVSYYFASNFSFPPENFLTLIAPWFFGDSKATPYWGRWFLTEVSIFVSVMGLVLAILGMVRGRPATRRFAITMLVVALILALGCYTPLFPILYRFVPGFDKFRGMDKFLWLAAIFLSLLAAIGMDGLLRRDAAPRWLAFGSAGAGFLLSLLASLPANAAWWGGILGRVVADKSSLLPEKFFSDPRFISLTGRFACESLMGGAIALFVAGGVLEFARYRRKWACLAALLVVLVELGDFARTSLFTFEITEPYPPSMAKFLAAHPGDYRIQSWNPNAAMSAGVRDISGDDPAGILRYDRFLDFAAGLDYDHPSSLVVARQHYDTNACRMLRGRYFFASDGDHFNEVKDVLPHLLLVDRFRVLKDYHKIFFTLTNADFKLDEEVILESQPNPLPQPAKTKGIVRLLAATTDTLTIEADTAAPALLFITDAYCSGWRVLALPGSVQLNYEIMPANYCLRAIPLSAGHHLLRLEYSPLGFRVGRVVSFAALAVFGALLGFAWTGRRPIHHA